MASIIPDTGTVMPGRFSTRLMPHCEDWVSCAWMKDSIQRPGDSSHTPVSSDTGHSETTPLRGSLSTPLANDEAARLGLPGRTTIVGRRRLRPSMNPLRV